MSPIYPLNCFSGQDTRGVGRGLRAHVTCLSSHLPLWTGHQVCRMRTFLEDERKDSITLSSAPLGRTEMYCRMRTFLEDVSSDPQGRTPGV
jgi:hypothetical protein